MYWLRLRISYQALVNVKRNGLPFEAASFCNYSWLSVTDFERDYEAIRGALLPLELRAHGLVDEVAAVGVVAVIHQQFDGGQRGGVDVD